MATLTSNVCPDWLRASQRSLCSFLLFFFVNKVAGRHDDVWPVRQPELLLFTLSSWPIRALLITRITACLDLGSRSSLYTPTTHLFYLYARCRLILMSGCGRKPVALPTKQLRVATRPKRNLLCLRVINDAIEFHALDQY